ncbi:uncharacterized protein [Mytilus edulis]|uniref:uncharacterized protein n=1 Tax=Mytilus edulis TaxID=6550 RepID=UPI0039F02795
MMENETVLQQLNIGRQPLHFAASIGNTDTIANLVGRGADVNCTDENGDAPLHLAVSRGHDHVAALLIALGANLEAENKEGYKALYIAVMDKSPRTVEILLRFGIDPCVVNWDWATNSNGSKEHQILEAFDRQCQLIPGFRNGFVSKAIVSIQPKQACNCKSVQVEIDTTKISRPFVLQLYKMQLEFANIQYHLQTSEQYFSDVYELRAWDCKEKEIQLKVQVNSLMRPNRQLKFVSLENCYGRIDESDNTFVNTDEFQTTVSLILKIQEGVYNKFVLVSEEKIEKIKILNSDTTFQPNVMPGAKVYIPTNALRQDTVVSFKVINTTELSDEVLGGRIFSDILVINTFQNIQLQKDVTITLPLHSKTECDDLVVLASNKVRPECVADWWQLIEPTDIPSTGFVSFNTDRYPLFAVVSRASLSSESSFSDIHETLCNVLEYKRKIVIMILTKEVPETGGDLYIVVHCVLREKANNTQTLWEEKGYTLLGVSDQLLFVMNTKFQISLSGNIVEIFHTKNMELLFQLCKENYRIFNVTIANKECKPGGNIKVLLATARKNVGDVNEEDASCISCGSNSPKTKRMDEFTSVLSCRLSFNTEALEVKEQTNIDTSSQKAKLRKIFDGFRLVYNRPRNKIVPMV